MVMAPEAVAVGLAAVLSWVGSAIPLYIFSLPSQRNSARYWVSLPQRDESAHRLGFTQTLTTARCLPLNGRGDETTMGSSRRWAPEESSSRFFGCPPSGVRRNTRRKSRSGCCGRCLLRCRGLAKKAKMGWRLGRGHQQRWGCSGVLGHVWRKHELRRRRAGGRRKWHA